VGRLHNPGAHGYAALKRTLLDTPRLMAEMFDNVDKRGRSPTCSQGAQHPGRGGASFGTAEETPCRRWPTSASR
jgi:hypothetical protein